MTAQFKRTGGSKRSAVASARHDLLTGGVTVAAIILFAGSGTRVSSVLLDWFAGFGPGADRVLSTALILNIALILFGWRRYRDLRAEVTERTAAEARAQQLANQDPLTGFHNRRSLAEQVTHLLTQTGERRRVAMMVIDLDHFKHVNDLHGHLAGDRLLQAAAVAIRDALPPSSIVARLGGDEFAASFIYDEDQAGFVDSVAEEIIDRLARPFDIEGVHAHISASLGIAHSNEDCSEVEPLLRRADIAMYVAKNKGRGRYAWFDGSMEREVTARNAIELGMREGIPLGQFVPYYEQQIDLASGRLQGFEVLARWEHPERGVIAPELFIPIAEETGMIGALSLAVMRRAFSEARDWDRSLSLSVNISPAQLKDPWLAQKIVKLLLETGFPAERLEIEITETALFENLPLAQSIVSSLKNQGIRLALDDFGTGYSSLAHLRALPFDRIKIDKSFVISMTQSTESAAIVNAIAKLGDSLGLPVTAEGIEDGAIEAQLRAIGCNKGQGWHFGRPMTNVQTRLLLGEQGMLGETTAPPAPFIPDQGSPLSAKTRKAG